MEENKIEGKDEKISREEGDNNNLSKRTKQTDKLTDDQDAAISYYEDTFEKKRPSAKKRKNIMDKVTKRLGSDLLKVSYYVLEDVVSSKMRDGPEKKLLRKMAKRDKEATRTASLPPGGKHCLLDVKQLERDLDMRITQERTLCLSFTFAACCVALLTKYTDTEKQKGKRFEAKQALNTYCNKYKIYKKYVVNRDVNRTDPIPHAPAASIVAETNEGVHGDPHASVEKKDEEVNSKPNDGKMEEEKLNHKGDIRNVSMMPMRYELDLNATRTEVRDNVVGVSSYLIGQVLIPEVPLQIDGSSILGGMTQSKMTPSKTMNDKEQFTPRLQTKGAEIESSVKSKQAEDRVSSGNIDKKQKVQPKPASSKKADETRKTQRPHTMKKIPDKSMKRWLGLLQQAGHGDSDMVKELSNPLGLKSHGKRVERESDNFCGYCGLHEKTTDYKVTLERSGQASKTYYIGVDCKTMCIPALEAVFLMNQPGPIDEKALGKYFDRMMYAREAMKRKYEDVEYEPSEYIGSEDSDRSMDDEEPTTSDRDYIAFSSEGESDLLPSKRQRT